MLYGNASMQKELEFHVQVMTLMSSQLDIKNAQIQALTERNEFLEDLIAELAVQAYSKSPSA